MKVFKNKSIPSPSHYTYLRNGVEYTFRKTENIDTGHINTNKDIVSYDVSASISISSNDIYELFEDSVDLKLELFAQTHKFPQSIVVYHHADIAFRYVVAFILEDLQNIKESVLKSYRKDDIKELPMESFTELFSQNKDAIKKDLELRVNSIRHYTDNRLDDFYETTIRVWGFTELSIGYTPAKEFANWVISNMERVLNPIYRMSDCKKLSFEKVTFNHQLYLEYDEEDQILFVRVFSKIQKIGDAEFWCNTELYEDMLMISNQPASLPSPTNPEPTRLTGYLYGNFEWIYVVNDYYIDDISNENQQMAIAGFKKYSLEYDYYKLIIDNPRLGMFPNRVNKNWKKTLEHHYTLNQVLRYDDDCVIEIAKANDKKCPYEYCGYSNFADASIVESLINNKFRYRKFKVQFLYCVSGYHYFVLVRP